MNVINGHSNVLSSPCPVFRIQNIYSQICSIFYQAEPASPMRVCKLAMCAKQKKDVMLRSITKNE